MRAKNYKVLPIVNLKNTFSIKYSAIPQSASGKYFFTINYAFTDNIHLYVDIPDKNDLILNVI